VCVCVCVFVCVCVCVCVFHEFPGVSTLCILCTDPFPYTGDDSPASYILHTKLVVYRNV
jgi:hypothetical protein